MDAAAGRSAIPFPSRPAAGGAVEIAEGVLWLRLPLPFRPDHLNVYALDDGDGWTIVDTGLDTAACRELWERLLAGPLAGRPVAPRDPDPPPPRPRRARRLVPGPRRRALGHPHRLADGADADPRRAGPPDARRRSPSGAAPGCRRRCWRSGRRRGRSTSPTWWRRCRSATAASSQGEEIVAGGRRWRVEIGHGHAPEQATLWGIGHDLVLAGDQVLPGITPNLGVYATEPDADPVGDWLASCARLAGLADERHLALPGHRRPFRGLPARLAELTAHQRGRPRPAAPTSSPSRGAATECFGVALRPAASAPASTGWRSPRRSATSTTCAARARPTRRLGPGRRLALAAPRFRA